MVKSDNSGKREKKRRSIMQAALKIFSIKGYSPAALEEVAREAKIAKGTLYLYFKDKEDLFSSTILFVIDNLAAIIEAKVDGSMGPIEILRSIAYTEIEYFSKNRDFFGLIHTIMSGNLLGDHERLLVVITEKRRLLVDYIFSVVEKGKQEHLFRADIDIDEIVYSYLGMVDSAFEQIQFGKSASPFNLERKVDMIMQILLEGIRENKKS